MVISPEIVRAKEALSGRLGEIAARRREYEQARREIELRKIQLPKRRKAELLRATATEQARFRRQQEAVKREQQMAKERVLRELERKQKEFEKRATSTEAKIRSEIKRLGEIGERIKAAKKSEVGLGVGLPAFYDPKTKEVIYQSMAPEIAKKAGYVPITVTERGLKPISLPEIPPSPKLFSAPQKVLAVEPGEKMIKEYREAWKERIRKRPIAGTLAYIGERAEAIGRKIAAGKMGEYGKIMPYAEPYQVEPTGKLFRTTAETAPFFTPAGPYVLTGLGIEHIATPAGREEIKQIGLAAEERYRIPKETAWLIPAAEIGLGVSPLFAKKYKPIKAKEITPVYKEIRAKVGKKWVSKYQVIQRIPAQKVEVTRRYREILGLKPIEIKTIAKPKTYVTWTPFPIKAKEPYVAITKRIGARYGTIMEVTGKQVPTSLAQFRKLPKYEQHAWRRLVEKHLTGGRPVSLERVPKMLRANIQKIRGFVEAEKLFRYAPKTKEVKWIKPAGRRIARAQVVSVVEKVKLPKELPFRVYKTVAGFKPTPKPFPRAAGKISYLKGKIIEIKKPITLPEPKRIIDLGKIKPAVSTLRGRVPPVTKAITITKTITKPPAPTPIFVPKVVQPAIPKVITEAKPVVYPRYVGGLGVGVTSVWAGKGMYEKTEEALTRLSGITGRAIALQVKPKIALRGELKPLVRGMEEVKVAAIPKLSPKLRAAIKVRLGLKPALKRVSKVSPVTKAAVIRKKPKLTPIPIPIPPISYPTPKGKIRRKLPIQLVRAYKAWIKRRGKWVPLAGIYTKAMAIRRGEKIAKRTLAATFKISPTAKFIKAIPEKYEPSPKIFRRYKIVKGKKVPLVEEWIQKAKFRLGTRGEVKEIQLARRKKTRKKKIRWI